jgi:hypothetical protein
MRAQEEHALVLLAREQYTMANGIVGLRITSIIQALVRMECIDGCFVPAAFQM